VQDALFGADAEVEPTWTVPDLSRAVGRLIEQAFPGEIWVTGEIRDLPPPGDARRNRPHLYFDLVEPAPDGGAVEARLPVVLWNSDRKRVNRDLRRSGVRVTTMESGVDVRIRGRVRWWGVGGRYQLQMTGIDPDYTLGRLAADRAAVLARLEADGLLDRNRAVPFPRPPERIGVVTSLGSAAHADVRRILGAARLLHLVVELDARTQGPDAITTIPRAIAAAVEARVDVVLLVRGGGSKVELACFDREEIARAVAGCPVPVVTGIGHEIDDSVTDRVAHTVAPTPTGAAAVVAGAVMAARDRAEAAWATIAATAGRDLDRRRSTLDATARRVAASAGARLHAGDRAIEQARARVRRRGPAALAGAEARLDATSASIRRVARRDLGAEGHRIDAAAHRLSVRVGPLLDRRDRDLAALAARVRAADPERALARGWTLTYGPRGLVRGAADVAVGDELVTHTAGGPIASTVTDTTPSDGAGSSDG